VRAVTLPFDIATADIAQFWHERCQRDEGHQWLRTLIHQLFHDHRAAEAVAIGPLRRGTEEKSVEPQRSQRTRRMS
jgi:hypothetical protein